MRIQKRSWGLASSFLLVVIGAAVVGYTLSATQEASRVQHREPDYSRGVNSSFGLEGGCHLVWHSDHRLVKYDREGHVMWEAPFERSSDRESTSINDLAVDGNGDILVFGVNDSRLTVLYSVDGPTGAVELVRQYRGIEPQSIGIAPNGTAYIIAFSAKRINSLIRNPSSLPESYSEDIMHELDTEGRIVRSFGRVTIEPESVQDLGDSLTDVTGRTIVFSTDGTAYLMDRERLELERVDLEKGDLTGVRIRLGAGRPSHFEIIQNIEFVSEAVALYTLIRVHKPDRLTRSGKIVTAQTSGWEARAINLKTGRSERLGEGPARQFHQAVYSSLSDEVMLIRLLDPNGKGSKQSWSAEGLRRRLESDAERKEKR